MGGWSYVYSAVNFTGVNLTLNKSKLSGSKNIDLTFSSNLDLASAQDTTNYLINFRQNNVATYTKIALLSAAVDPTNNSVVHLITKTDLPIDTCDINVSNIKGTNNITVINNSASSFSSVIHTSLTDYSTLKYAIIGSCYFLNNVSGGTKAAWNTCWSDVANNVQASVPVISGNAKIFTWSFPAVLMFGGVSQGDGMFKFCNPNTDNTPNWSIEPIGYPATRLYSGSATTDLDRISDAGGAFTILTLGLTKKYNLKLIIDQTSGVDQITVDINGVNTAVPSVNLADAVIVSYRVYNEAGILLTMNKMETGLNIQQIKQLLDKGLYLINARFKNGEYHNYKFIVQ